MSKMKSSREANKISGTGNIGNIILILVKHGTIYFRIMGTGNPWKSLTFKAR